MLHQEPTPLGDQSKPTSPDHSDQQAKDEETIKDLETPDGSSVRGGATNGYLVIKDPPGKDD